MTARTLPTPTQAPPSTLPTLLSTDQDQLAPSATLAAAPWDGEELLRSLQRLGVAHDLQESDLTLPDLQQAASSSSSSSSSASRMSMLLSRLSLLLSDLSRLQEDQIRTHLPTLLDRASGVQSLEGQVREVRRLLADVEVGVEKLSNPTRRSLVRLERDQRRLRRLHSVQDLLGGAARYVSTARRLETHLQTLFDGDDDGDVVGDAQCRAMVDAAHCLESLASLTAPPLTSLAFIASYSPSITAARGQVVDKMESSIVAGLRDLSPSLLSTSLQTADVLGLLPDLVSDLLRDLTDVVKRCVVKALGSIDRREWDAALADDEAASSSSPSSSPAPYRSKRHQQQGQQRDMRRVTRAQDAFCAHFDTLMTTEMTAVCSKIYLLQRVLGLMRAARTRKEDDGGEGGDEEEDEGGESNSRTLLDDSVKVSRLEQRTGECITDICVFDHILILVFPPISTRPTLPSLSTLLSRFVLTLPVTHLLSPSSFVLTLIRILALMLLPPPPLPLIPSSTLVHVTLTHPAAADSRRTADAPLLAHALDVPRVEPLVACARVLLGHAAARSPHSPPPAARGASRHTLPPHLGIAPLASSRLLFRKDGRLDGHQREWRCKRGRGQWESRTGGRLSQEEYRVVVGRGASELGAVRIPLHSSVSSLWRQGAM